MRITIIDRTDFRFYLRSMKSLVIALEFYHWHYCERKTVETTSFARKNVKRTSLTSPYYVRQIYQVVETKLRNEIEQRHKYVQEYYRFASSWYIMRHRTFGLVRLKIATRLFSTVIDCCHRRRRHRCMLRTVPRRGNTRGR